ncbi:MAG TPA: hypothetical protein VN132_14655 [Bdellovibrio sp.]|nr:hypothetical protein [Bdellovibrio sp.]
MTKSLYRAILFFIPVIVFNSSALASYKADCFANDGRIQVEISISNGRLYLNYSNYLGAVDFPLFEGVVTKGLLPLIKIAEKDLSGIDHELRVSWPLESCHFHETEAFIMGCQGKAQIHSPKKIDLAFYSLSANVVTEQTLDQTYKIYKLRWGVQGPGNYHFISMTFDPETCRVKKY